MKLTQEEIVAKIENEESIAYGINDSQLSTERAEAIQYYLGEPFGNEVVGIRGIELFRGERTNARSSTLLAIG